MEKRETRGWGLRVNFGQKKSIIGIDVANTGKTGLVEKDKLDGTGSGVKLRNKIVESEAGREKIGTKRGLKFF